MKLGGKVWVNSSALAEVKTAVFMSEIQEREKKVKWTIENFKNDRKDAR